MIIKEIQENEKEIWDSFVSTHPEGHLLQSYGWGEVKAKAGWMPIRLFVEDQGQTKAAIQILKRKIPLTGRCIFCAPRGPVLDRNDYATFDFLLDEVKKIAHKHKAIFFMIDPAVSDEDTVLKEYLNGQGFVFPGKYGVVGLTLPKRVFHVDLSSGEDELMVNMAPNHRRNIRRARKEAVVIERRSDKEGLKIFYDLYKEMSRRKHFYIRSFNYQKSLLEAFHPDGNFDIFLAMHQGCAIAGRLILRYGNKSWDMYAATDTSYMRLNAGYLLVWEVFRAMKAEGCALFDFGGADGKDPASPLYGVHMFKKGFGPQHVEYIGEYYFVFSQFYFDLINLGKVLLKWALKMYKNFRAFNVFVLINKLFCKNVDEKALRNTVFEKYGQKEELKIYEGILKLGLLDAERRIVNKYFKKGNSVLNIGCGAGREAVALLKKGFQVAGIDMHPKMIERSMQNARIHNVQGRFAVMDACQMTFGDDSFDQAVMFGSVISYIPKTVNRIAALKEAKRVLKKGGYLIISTPNRRSHIKYLAYFSVVNMWRALCKKIIKDYSLEANDRLGRKTSRKKTKGRVYSHMYSLDEMAEDIKSAGLTVVECRANRELMMDIDSPKDREKDYFLYFVAKKEN